MCAPVFNAFMQTATEKYGGGPFEVPEGGHFIKIDRFSGERLHPEDSGPHVVAEYFRGGEEPIFGLGALIDGGFAMGSNLPLFTTEELEAAGQIETTEDGEELTVNPNASFGTLSSGGLY